MDRRTWLEERRASVRLDYDATADEYDAEPYPNEAQQVWVSQLLATSPAGGVVLDAPCGTGRYFELVTAAARQVVGVDQSAGMLARARDRGLAIELHQVGLQELSFPARFDAAMTVDAMEHVPPEDWPRVLANVHRALRPGAQWYLTVEEQDRSHVAEAFDELRRAGLPAVEGEVVSKGTGGYHYYPDRAQVLRWFAAEGLAVVAEDHTQYDGWGYRHFLLADGKMPAPGRP